MALTNIQTLKQFEAVDPNDYNTLNPATSSIGRNRDHMGMSASVVTDSKIDLIKKKVAENNARTEQ